MLPIHLIALAAASQGAPAGWDALERRGATISEIVVDREDVFDLSKRPENNLVGRLGDKLHRLTREKVVRGALLFKVGDRLNVRRIRETERYLRTLVFLKDARIDLEPLPGGTVRVRVWTRDAWTLKGTLNYKLQGGQQTQGIGIQDQNLLGTGKTLAFSWLKDPARTTQTFAYLDPRVLGSDWTLTAAYQKLSDGSTRALYVQRPYLSLDTPWSGTLQILSKDSTLTIYDHGDSIYSAPSHLDTLAAGFSWAAVHTERVAWRPGAAVVSSEARYGPLATLAPPGGLAAPDLAHRRLQGPALSLTWLEDGYRVFRNLAAMDTAEDYNTGWSGSLVAGAYLTSWSSTERAPFFQGGLAKGWSGSDRGLILAQASASGRKGPAGWEDALADFTVNGYWMETDHQITAAHLALDAARRPDPEDLYYVGALQGLRGYVNYLHPGNGRWLFSAEQRMLTEQRWLGILRLGYVAFVDAGAIHRMDGTGWSAPYADVGAGLRLGDLKSSLGHVVLITAAVPVVKEAGQRGWYLAVGNITQF